jgi:uncharacterized MAPEG superfamily protein
MTMNVAYFCVLLAGITPVICTAIAKWEFKEFDNHNPREWLARQTGFRARANAAQHNSFEAFPFFAAAVIMATLSEVEPPRVELLSVIFIVARWLYVAFYITDRPTLRTLCWVLAYACVVTLMAMSL